MKSQIAISLLVATSVLALPQREFNNVSPFHVENRMIGGSPAEPGQFPFQVGIRMHAPLPGIGKMNWWCGASLIADNLVLTAAHCVKGAETVEIILGATDLSQEEPNREVFTVTKDSIIMHEQYDGARAANDIALIRLPRSANLNSYVQTVNLPRLSQKDQTFERTIGWISGWGMSGNFKKSFEQLQYAQQWIIPTELCENHFTVFQKDTQICVDGSNKVSPCGGDFGGPLTIIEKDGSRTLVGIASYGSPQGCEAGNPVGFTRVGAFLDWIAEKGRISIRN